MKSRVDASSLRPFREPPETVSVPMALSLASWVAVPVQLWRRGRSRSGDPRGERMKGRMQRLSYPAFSSRAAGGNSDGHEAFPAKVFTMVRRPSLNIVHYLVCQT